MTGASDTVIDNRIKYPGIGWLLLAWSAVGVLTSARFLIQPVRPEPFALSMILVSIACFAPWALLSPLAFRLERQFPLGAAAWIRNLSKIAVRSVPICVVGSPLMLLGVTLVWRVLGLAPVSKPHSVWFWFIHIPVAAVCFWGSVAAGYLIRTRHELREYERREARLALEKSQLESGLKQAQLEALRAKLNPHFLFNSLQNIAVLTRHEPEIASRMLVRLGDLLRAVLRGDSTPESPLSEEIALAEAYVALEQLRFADRLRVVFEIEPEAQAGLVPCFILQPLIENAILHGLRGSKKDGFITISAARHESDLVLRVTDNGVGLPSPGLAKLNVGMGLRSTCERLERMYPHRHTFAISGRPQGGTEVRITQPFRTIDPPAKERR